MPGPYTSFTIDGSDGFVAAPTEMVSAAMTTGSNNPTGSNLEISAIASPLTGWTGKAVPQTGQMFPSRTA